MILLTGATGAVGFALANLLSGRGTVAKAMVRSPEAAQKLAGLRGILPVLGDLDEPASLDAALEGIDRVFLLTNSSERAEAQQLALVDAAKRAGVRHIVKLSQLHADADSPVRFLRYHANVERAIRDSGLDYTFLRPNLFMQALLSFRESIVHQGQFYAPINKARISIVDIRDIAEIAAEALTGIGHSGRIYNITGPEALSHDEIAAHISAAIDKPVKFVEVTPDAMRQAVLDVGFPQWQADGLIEDYAHYDQGEAMSVSPDVELVTSRPGRSFTVFLTDCGHVLRH